MTSRWNALAYILLVLSWLVGAVFLALIVIAASSSAPDGSSAAVLPRPAQSGTPQRAAGLDADVVGVPPTYAVLGAMVEAEIGTVLLGGKATFYRTPGLTGAAGPVLRDVLGDWRGQRVTVCASRCVTVTLTDWCACGERGGEPTLIDLSDAAFRRLGPLSAGVLDVTIEIGGGPRPTLPPTDSLEARP